MLETEVKRVVAAQILAERKLKLGKGTDAQLADATRVAWEQCENLARQRNPDDLNLARAIHSKTYEELRALNDDDLQRLVSVRMVKLDVLSDEPLLSSDVMQSKTLSSGETKAQGPGDAVLTWEGEDFAKAAGIPHLIHFALDVGSGIASGLMTAWVWDKFKGKSIRSISIDRTLVEFDEGKIKRVLQERIEKK